MGRIREVFPHNNVVLEKVPGHQAIWMSSMALVEKFVSTLLMATEILKILCLATHSVDYDACRALFSCMNIGLLRIKKVLGAPAERKSLGWRLFSFHDFKSGKRIHGQRPF